METEKKTTKEVSKKGKSYRWLEVLFVALALVVVVGTPIALYKGNTSVAASSSTDRTFDILARNDMVDSAGRWLVQNGSGWDYSNLSAPSIITVNEGDRVALHLTSFDETHGFELDAFGINKPVYAGKFTDVTFVANKAGKFQFVCSVYCGDGHNAMTGWLIVKPASTTSQKDGVKIGKS